MFVNQGRLVAKGDNSSQARDPAQRGKAVRGAHADEEIAREEGDTLFLAALPNLDEGKIGLEPPVFQEATKLPFFMWLGV